MLRASLTKKFINLMQPNLLMIDSKDLGVSTVTG